MKYTYLETRSLIITAVKCFITLGPGLRLYRDAGHWERDSRKSRPRRKILIWFGKLFFFFFIVATK
jgi:hypothetical protein